LKDSSILAILAKWFSVFLTTQPKVYSRSLRQYCPVFIPKASSYMTTQADLTPTPRDLFYVSTADLTAKRPPPKLNLLASLVRNPLIKRLVGLAYFVVVLIVWQPLLSALGLQLSSATEAGLLAIVMCLPLVVITLADAIGDQRRTGVPFYRDIEFIRNTGEIILLFLIINAGATLFNNLQANLAQSGLVIDFGVIARQFGVELTEGPDVAAPLDFLNGVPVLGDAVAATPALRPNTVLRALMVGFVNTLRVSALALVATTFLGILVGVGLLSRNWLIRNVADAFTEIFRNTPLLVQLFFLYNGVIKLLPPRPREALELVPGAVYVSGRGIFYPGLVSADNANIVTVFVVIGIVVALLLWRWRVRVHEETGKAANVLLYILGAVLGFSAAGLIVATLTGGFPFSFDMPQRSNFNFTGGTNFSAEFLTLFLGLTLYTAAFIADIVRAGIQSVHKGQIEAARALGLNGGQTFNKVVLPQALRLAVPPLTNQYLNLVKNSSLGIAIGFVDLYNVGTIAYNQTGQAISMFAIMAVIYLAVSLLISFVMNLFNNTLRLRTR
jgi:general L-amino acid transport system permease protein